MDWSNWGDEWADPSSEVDNDQKGSSGGKSKVSSSSWNDWNDEQLSPVADREEEKGYSNGRSSLKKPSSQSNVKDARKKQTIADEPNLIDFELGSENVGSKSSSAGAKSTTNDGWDTEEWAEVDDDNWESIE